MRRFLKRSVYIDTILILVILFVAVIFYWFFDLNVQKSPDETAVVRQGGKVLLQLTREEMKKDGIFDFKFGGHKGQIEVKGGRIRMLPMDKTICPLSICSDTGWIEGSPQAIICMPNRLIISFSGGNGGGIDSVAY